MEKNMNKVAEVRLIYKSRVKSQERLQVKQSKDAFEIFFSLWNKDTIEHVEEFKILLLNRSNKVLGTAPISLGGTSGTVTDVKIILQYALKANASGIIICHNHPSASLMPSESDTKITFKIKEAASLLDMQLLDHIIISPNREYYSYADNGVF